MTRGTFYWRKLIPRPVKGLIQRLRFIPIDLWEGFRGRDALTPPRSMIFVGDGDFRKVGEEFKRYFVELGGLAPDARVLEVGCGIGRMAVPLTGFLSSSGEYHGFDIVAKGITWCQTRITPRFPNFRFFVSDVYNDFYNPTGTVRSSEYVFPFEDGYFDFVFLTSVFTHMMIKDLERYLTEVTRVLKPGGRCLMTYFLLNPESRSLVSERKSTLDFAYEIPSGLTIDRYNPERATAYEEKMVRGLYHENRLTIIEPIRYGSWCGRPSYLSYQDIVLAEK
jgi:ubiquinone/menaquinone biosynthesis C-methylase UbiE